MVINYIYNDKGVAEYVIIPTDIWDIVQDYLKNKKIKIESPEIPKHKKINPKEFYGTISHLKLDIDQELKNMREEWTRNF
jgi:hypothetical protein